MKLKLIKYLKNNILVASVSLVFLFPLWTFIIIFSSIEFFGIFGSIDGSLFEQWLFWIMLIIWHVMPVPLVYLSYMKLQEKKVKHVWWYRISLIIGALYLFYSVFYVGGIAEHFPLL